MRAIRTGGTFAIFALCLLALHAPAQMLLPAYGTYGAPTSNFLSTSHLLQQVAGNATRTAAPRGGSKPAAHAPAAAGVSFVSNGATIAPKKLAQGYPQQIRSEAEKLFALTLEQYHRLEANFGIPKYDLGGAMAAFVAGNLVAYSDEPFPDAQFQALVQQMREAISRTPAINSASQAERQELYEQLAIVGTYMALTREALQRSGDRDKKTHMRAAAFGYLEQFLQIDPARARITAAGLVVN